MSPDTCVARLQIFADAYVFRQPAKPKAERNAAHEKVREPNVCTRARM
jgi:hypothetical protein